MRYVNFPLSRQFILGIILNGSVVFLAAYLVYMGACGQYQNNIEGMINSQSSTIFNFMEEKNNDDITSFIQVLENNPLVANIPEDIAYIEWESDKSGREPIIRTATNSTIKPIIIEHFKEKITEIESNSTHKTRPEISQYICDYECFVLNYKSYQINELTGTAITAVKLKSISELIEKLNDSPTIMLYDINDNEHEQWLSQKVNKLSWNSVIEPNRSNHIINQINKYRTHTNGNITYRELLDSISYDLNYDGYVISKIKYNHQSLGYTVTFLPNTSIFRSFKLGAVKNIFMAIALLVFMVIIGCHYTFNLIRLNTFFHKNKKLLNEYASGGHDSSNEIYLLISHLKSSLESNVKQSEKLKSLHNKLESYSNYDPHTSLPNQKWIMEQLTRLQQIKKINSAIDLYAVEFCPVLPKSVYENDEISHQISSIMLDLIDEKDYLAIYEPTVYYLLTTSIKSKNEIDDLLDKFRHELMIQVNEGQEVRISAGIVHILSTGINPSIIMKQTHTAYLRSCESNMMDSYTIYTDSMLSENPLNTNNISFINAFKKARMKGDIVLRYDQVMNITDKTIHSLIARSLWFQDGTANNIEDYTDQIISSGINTEFSYWKIENAMHDLAELDQDTSHSINMIIPLNYEQLLDSNLLSFLDLITVKYHILPNRVTFALTENTISNDVTECIKAIESLIKNGYHIALQNYNHGMIDMDFIVSHEISSVMVSGSLTKRVLTSEFDRYMMTELIKRWQTIINVQIILQDIDSMITMETFRELGTTVMTGSLFPCQQSLSAVKAYLNKDDNI